MDLALCHSSGASNVEVGPRVLENVWTPALIGRGVFFSYHIVFASSGNVADTCISCINSLWSSPQIHTVIQTSNAELR
jgi:hypothetical protein